MYFPLLPLENMSSQVYARFQPCAGIGPELSNNPDARKDAPYSTELSKERENLYKAVNALQRINMLMMKNKRKSDY